MEEESAFRLIWTRTVISDLSEVRSYIAEDNPEAAQRVAEGIVEKAEALKLFPYIGHVARRDRKGPIRENVFRHTYRIIYRVSESLRRVDVIRVWHGARDEPPLGASECD